MKYNFALDIDTGPRLINHPHPTIAVESSEGKVYICYTCVKVLTEADI